MHPMDVVFAAALVALRAWQMDLGRDKPVLVCVAGFRIGWGSRGPNHVCPLQVICALRLTENISVFFITVLLYPSFLMLCLRFSAGVSGRQSFYPFKTLPAASMRSDPPVDATAPTERPRTCARQRRRQRRPAIQATPTALGAESRRASRATPRRQAQPRSRKGRQQWERSIRGGLVSRQSPDLRLIRLARPRLPP